MRTRTERRAGWIELARAGVHVLAKGDDALREQLASVLAAAGGDTLPDVLTDALTIGGVRGAPDFAVVDEADGRVLVRGGARVELVGADGTTRVVLAPTRAPWTDEDIPPGTTSAVLSTGEPEPVDGAARRPQFVDGHLVGVGVPAAAGGADAAGPGTGVLRGAPTGIMPIAPGTGGTPGADADEDPPRLVLPTGETITLDRGVVLGRAPRASAAVGAAGEPHLVRVASPDNEISRSHVEVYRDGARVLVRDLGSTNGTSLTPSGGSTTRLGAGPHPLEPGATIRLAGRVAVVLETGS